MRALWATALIAAMLGLAGCSKLLEQLTLPTFPGG